MTKRSTIVFLMIGLTAAVASIVASSNGGDFLRTVPVPLILDRAQESEADSAPASPDTLGENTDATAGVVDLAAVAAQAPWARLSAACLPSRNSVRHVERDADGAVWMRVERLDESDLVIVMPADGSDWRVFESLQAAASAWYDRLTGAPAPGLRDFWAGTRPPTGGPLALWVGGRRWNGTTWETVADDVHEIGYDLLYERRAVADGKGGAWIPYESRVECEAPGGCVSFGLDGFADASSDPARVPFERPSGAVEHGIQPVLFMPPDGDGQGHAVTARALFALPESSPISFPNLDPPGAAPIAGYATAAMRDRAGRLRVFTWLEDRGSRGRESRIEVLTRDGDSWLPPLDLSGLPLVEGRQSVERIVAVAQGGSGELWLATSSGYVGAYTPGDTSWDSLLDITPEGLGIEAGEVIFDMAVSTDGTVWLATSRGLRSSRDVPSRCPAGPGDTPVPTASPTSSPTPTPTPLPSERCFVDIDKSAAPTRVAVGEPIQINLQVTLSGCAGASVALRSLQVRDEIPDDMELVSGSVTAGGVVSGREVVWTLTDVPVGSTVELGLRVIAFEEGRQPTNVRAEAQWIDVIGREGNAIFPVPIVAVLRDPSPVAVFVPMVLNTR